MDIYLTDFSHPLGRERFRFPVIPEEIRVRTGAVFASYSIIGKGEIKLPAGRQLTGFSWDCFLPGKARSREPYVKGNYYRRGVYMPGAIWRDPKEIQGMWSVWQASGTKLRLLATTTPINHDVYIDTYNMRYSGGAGDYQYTINFLCAIDLTVQRIGEDGAAEGQGGTRPDRQTPATYTVVYGDTLSKIAQKFLGDGSKYPLIYEANREVIGGDPHTIHAGQVLKIPA